jgi:hypothetical protein
MVVAWWLATGCSDDGGGRDRDTDGPTGSPTSTGETAGTGTTGDTAVAPPAPTFPDDCDPDVHVPVYGGFVDPLLLPDPHEEVYGLDPAPFAARYSWPGTDPSTSAAFLWRTDIDTRASLVEITAMGEAPFTVAGASFQFGPVGTGAPVYRVHEVKLCQRLQPGTSYRYRVGGPGSWSQSYAFATPAAPGTFDTARVAIAGDSRGSYAEWAMLVAAAETFEPDFYLFTGDAVSSGSNQTEWDYWYMATAEVFSHKALVPVHGNHEGLAVNWFAQVSLPGNEQWYRIRYGPLDLAILNDTSISTDQKEAQATWIGEVFGPSSAEWKIAAHHQPAYSTNTNHGSNLDLRATWSPPLEAAGFDLVFNGHDHTYERSVPVLAEAAVEADVGITYVVTGGAGAPLYMGSVPEWFSQLVVPIEHFVIVDFSATEAHAVVRDLAGNVIDDFTIPAD